MLGNTQESWAAASAQSSWRAMLLAGKAAGHGCSPHKNRLNASEVGSRSHQILTPLQANTHYSSPNPSDAGKELGLNGRDGARSPPCSALSSPGTRIAPANSRPTHSPELMELDPGLHAPIPVPKPLTRLSDLNPFLPTSLLGLAMIYNKDNKSLGDSCSAFSTLLKLVMIPTSCLENNVS